MRKKFSISLILFLLSAAGLGAHENWISADNYFPLPGEAVKLYVESGHNFPLSDTLISQKLIEGIQITSPAGERKLLGLTAESPNNRHRAWFKVTSTGSYVAAYRLKRERMDEPLAEGRTVIISGPDPGSYITGRGLEIAPMENLSALTPGDKLQMGLFYNGQRTGGVLKIKGENSRSYTMRTTAQRPAEINIDRAGKYMVITSKGGKSYSFTFFVREGGNEKH